MRAFVFDFLAEFALAVRRWSDRTRAEVLMWENVELDPTNGPALERLSRGERPIREGVSYDDVDAWNARFASARRGTPVTDVLLELDKTHEYFLRAAAGVPAERFQPGKTAWKIVDQNTAHHYREHADQIRAWRTSKSI